MANLTTIDGIRRVTARAVRSVLAIRGFTQVVTEPLEQVRAAVDRAGGNP